MLKIKYVTGPSQCMMFTHRSAIAVFCMLDGFSLSSIQVLTDINLNCIAFFRGYQNVLPHSGDIYHLHLYKLFGLLIRDIWVNW